MALQAERKNAIIQEYASFPGDTGSDRAPDAADRRHHRTSANAPTGSRQPARPADAQRTPASAAQLSTQQRRSTLSESDPTPRPTAVTPVGDPEPSQRSGPNGTPGRRR